MDQDVLPPSVFSRNAHLLGTVNSGGAELRNRIFFVLPVHTEQLWLSG